MTVSSISSKELMSATASCSHVQEQTRVLLEKIDEMRAELIMMGGFLDLPLQMRKVPHGRIQAILTKYRTEDGAACKSQIEENIRLYAGMVRVRIKENGDVLMAIPKRLVAGLKKIGGRTFLCSVNDRLWCVQEGRKR